MKNNKYEILLEEHRDDKDKIFEIYKEYILDQLFEENYEKVHQIYNRALNIFSKDRSKFYELLMSEIRIYFFSENKINEGFDLFLLGIVPLDEFTERLLFYRIIYALSFDIDQNLIFEYIKNLNFNEYILIINNIIDSISKSDVELFTSNVIKLDKSNIDETHILLKLKNKIKNL